MVIIPDLRLPAKFYVPGSTDFCDPRSFFIGCEKRGAGFIRAMVSMSWSVDEVIEPISSALNADLALYRLEVTVPCRFTSFLTCLA